MGGERAAGRLAEARHDIHYAVRQPGLGDQLSQPQCGQRGLLSRLEHHGAPGRERGGELPRGHQQREVPRNDLPYHADRLPQRVAVEVRARHVGHRDVDRVALDLGGPAGHVLEHVRRQGHVRDLRDGIRLAVVERLELGKLVEVLVDQVTDLPDEASALGRRHLAPWAVVECRARGPDSPVDVLGASLGDAREGLASRRVRGLERPA